MTMIASALALAISLAPLGAPIGEGHHTQTIHPDQSAPQISISATEKLNWTRCTATTQTGQISIPSAKTESECISLALKCVRTDDVQWTYHPFYVTTDSSFKRCDLSIS